MARVDIGLSKVHDNLEVGDMVVSEVHGARLVVAHNDFYLGINIENGRVSAKEDSLKDLERLYCQGTGKCRIIKSNNIVVSEIGGGIR